MRLSFYVDRLNARLKADAISSPNVADSRDRPSRFQPFIKPLQPERFGNRVVIKERAVIAARLPYSGVSGSGDVLCPEFDKLRARTIDCFQTLRVGDDNDLEQRIV